MIAQDAGYSFAVWARHRDAFLKNWTTETGGMVIEPVLLLVAIGYGLGQFVGEVDGGVGYAEFVAPGFIAGYAMFHSLLEAGYGAFLRMSMHRIYDNVLATPVGVSDLVVGECLWGATRSAMSSVAVLSVAAALGLVSSPWALLILPAGFLTGLAFYGMGLCYTSIAPSIASVNNLVSIFALPMFYVSGIFFPLSALPDAVQVIAWALPLTPAAYLIRGLFMGDLGPTHLLAILELAAYAAAFTTLAVRLVRRRLLP